MRIAIGLVLLAACSRSSPPSPAAPPSNALVAARPYGSRAPSRHDAHAPLLIALHGFGGDGAAMDSTFHLRDFAEAHGVFVAFPDGTPDPKGRRFWNATDACCDFYGAKIDDVAYLDAIVDDAIARWSVDPARVYVMGLSNGGFMAHRYACDRADRVAAVASVAGDAWADASRCAPKAPVSVLQIHGDADDIILYAGGRAPDAAVFRAPEFARAAPYPPIRAALTTWSRLDGCPAPTTSDGPREEVLRWSGCAQGSEVQLWTRHGAKHWPDLTPEDFEKTWSFLSAHRR